MSRHHAGQFYEIVDHLLKVILLSEHMVPPYGIRWKRTRRKNALKYFQKFSIQLYNSNCIILSPNAFLFKYYGITCMDIC